MGSEAVTDSYYGFFQKVENSLVTPAIKSRHEEKLGLSHLDHLHMDRYVPMVVLYRLADGSDVTYRQFVNLLKVSLAKVVVAFYPVAGRILETSDPAHPRLLLCNDEGVPFTEAFKDEDMDELVDQQNYQPIPWLSGLEPAGLNSLKQCQAAGESGNPTFVVQVTRFRCGGVCLAISWNHLLADMAGAMLFMKAWSDIGRTGQTSIVPQLDRSALDPRVSKTDSTESGTGSRGAKPLSAEENAKLQKVLTTTFQPKVLHIRKEKIERVKREAVQDEGAQDVSTMDCVSAHLWRCLARVYANAGISEVTIFSTAVEGRLKMPGTLSPHYFGNVIVPAFVNGVPASEILNRPLSYAASLIRKAIKGINDETYWSIIDKMDLANPWKTSINRTDYQLGLTSWIRFGVYDLDFGAGNPDFVFLNHMPQNARKGHCIVHPSKLGSGFFAVLLYLTPQTLEALWADPEFISLS